MIDQKFRSDVIFGYITQSCVVVATFLFMLLVTRFGSMEVYGALMLLVSMSGILVNLVSFRTDEALVSFYKQGEVSSDWGKCKFSIFSCISLDVVSGCILFSILYFNDEKIASIFFKDFDATQEVKLFGLVILLTSLKSTPTAFLQATERFKLVNSFSLIEQIVKLFVVSYMFFLTGEITLRNAIEAALAATLISNVIAYFPLLYTLMIKLKRYNTRWERGLIRNFAKFCLNTFSSSALKAGNLNIDTLILGLVTNVHSVGIYATFRQFLSPISFISTPYIGISYPKFVKYILENRTDEIKETIWKINRKLLLMAAFLAIFAAPMLFAYLNLNNVQLDLLVYSAFPIMALSSILNNQLWWGRPLANAFNPTISLYANAISTALSLAFIYPLGLVLGITGVSLGKLISLTGVSMYYKRVLITKIKVMDPRPQDKIDSPAVKI